MKICKLCGSTYGDRVEFCFRDGQPLELAPEPEAAPSPEDLPEPPGHRATDAPMPRGRPSVADMLDVPEPGFARPYDPTALPDPTGLPDPAGLPEPTALPEPAAAEALPDVDPASGEPLPEAPLPEEPLPEEPDGTEEVPAPFDDTGDIGDEALAPPAALAPPEPTAPVPAPLADGDQTISEEPDDVPATGPEGEEDLPGPQELDEGMDAAAVDEVSRALGGGVDDEDEEDEAPAVAAPLASGADDLDSLAAATRDAPPARPAPTPVEHIPYADEPQEEGGNKGIYMLFGAVLLGALILGGGWYMSQGGEKTDPMAGKPAETAAPVRPAPAPPTPAPAPPEPAGPPDDGTADADGTDDGATDDGATDAGATDDGATDDGATAPDAGSATEPAAAPPAQPAAAPPREDRTPVSTPPAATAPPVDEPVAEASPPAGGDPWGSNGANTGRLTINTAPQGATVYVGGRQLGRSPLTTEVAYGSHEIRVELAGHQGGARTVQLGSPELAVPFELEPLMAQGTVNIFGPTGATVYVDGAEVGKIPTSVKLSEGAHRFKVVGTDGATFEHSQDVRFGGGSTVSVTLSPR